MKLVRRYSILIILIILAFFFPYSLKNHAKLTMRVIITGFAIDKNEDKYEVTAQAIIPTISSGSGAGQSKIDFISEEGNSVSDCINSIAYNIGKIAALSHVTFIVVGEGVLSENIVGQLDFFVRNDKLPDSLLVLICDGSAKDTIKKTKDFDVSVAINMQQVFLDKEENMNGIMTTLIDVFNSSKNISTCLCVSGLNITSESEKDKGKGQPQESSSGGEQNPESGGGGSSAGGAGGESGGGIPESGKSRIDYHNKVYLLKNGNFVGVLDDPDSLMGFYLSHKKSTHGDIAFKHVDGNEEYYIGINIRDKKEDVQSSFENGKIVTEIKIRLASAKIFEITCDKESANDFYYDKSLEDVDKYRKAITKYIEKTVKNFCEKAKAQNFDVFMTADNLFKWHPFEWEEYLKNHDKNNYAKDIEYKVSCEIQDLF